LIHTEDGERPRSRLLSCKRREFLSKYLCGRLKKELLCRSDFTRLGLRS
jgi:hypothetical protein